MQAYRNMFDAQTTAAREYATALQDEQTACYTDVMQISASAESQWRTACETYLQELRAASAGDDAQTRAAAAYRNLQHEYERIHDEFSKATEARYGRMAQTLRSHGTQARVKAIDGWIAYLHALRDATLATPDKGEAAGS